MKTNYERMVRFELSANGVLLNLIFIIYVALLLLITIGWRDALIGGKLQYVVSIFNPYVRDVPLYQGREYFIRCHVLAFSMAPLILYILSKSRSIQAQARLIVRERKARLSNYLLVMLLVLCIIYIPSMLHIHPDKSSWSKLFWVYPWSVPIVAFGFVRIAMTIICTCLWITRFLTKAY